MILLISNDKRMAYLSQYLKTLDVDVCVYDNQALAFDLNMMQEVEYLILPFGGLSETGQIANTSLILTKEVLNAMPRHATIFTPIRYPKLIALLTEVSRTLEVIFDHDEVAIYNSIPTAEGVVYHMIQQTNATIHQSKVLVVGAGRTGMTIARTLKALGAQVSVTYRQEKDAARLFEMGVEPVHIDSMVKTLSSYETIVNTVPVMLFSKTELDQVNQACYIIDVSSKPGGVDFEYAKKVGIIAELTGSLPSYIAPKTAAYYLFKFIQNYMMTNHSIL